MVKIKAIHIIIYKTFQGCYVFQTTYIYLFWSFIKCFCTSYCSAMPNIIKCSVSLFLWKLCFCSLYAFCINEAFQNFSSRYFDIHSGASFLFNTNSNAKIVSHYHVIMNLNRMIVGNIWTLISSVGGINWINDTLKSFMP